jgi:hypothetical protein
MKMLKIKDPNVDEKSLFAYKYYEGSLITNPNPSAETSQIKL